MRYSLHLDLYVADDPTVESSPQLELSMDADDAPNSDVVVAARLLVIGAATSTELWAGGVYDAVRCRVVDADRITVGVASMNGVSGQLITEASHDWLSQVEGWRSTRCLFADSEWVARMW
jgi:hypothetical protein